MDVRSFTGKEWRVRDDLRSQLPSDPRASRDALVRYFLSTRNVTTLGEHIAIAHCGCDAQLFPDLPRAIHRVRAAVTAGERVAVFGDYDCDGITSTALLSRWFARRGVRPLLRLPHRLHEGYGLRESIVREMLAAGVTLLLTVDTGITAVREIERAQAGGMDVIILDHHHVPEEVPEAYAILHPLLAPGMEAPHPSAAGVTWAFVRALETVDGNAHADWPDRDVDLALAAIGTIADLVELRGGNRTLVEAGLRAFNRIERGPMAFLRLQTGLMDAGATSRDIAFRIAPRLNAAGRMAEPDIALRAVLGDEQSLLRLEELNRDRQQLVMHLMLQAAAAIDPRDMFLCLRSPDYLPGVCGLLAGKLTERHGKPSLVAHVQGETCVASLRSIPPYNVTEGLHSCADLLLSYGGHAMAAGCSFPAAAFDTLRERLCGDVAARVPAEGLAPSLMPDAHVHAHHLTLQLSEGLRCLEPHGQGNPEPSFLLTGVTFRDRRRVGKDALHLQAMLGDKKVVGFQFGGFSDAINGPIDLVCRLGIDTWQGRRMAQLFVEDMRVAVPDVVGVTE